MSVERPQFEAYPQSHRPIIQPENNITTLELIKNMGSELPQFTRSLIKGLSRDDTIMTPERRARMLTMLTWIPYEQLDPVDIGNTYIRAVSWQNERSDPNGTINDLLTAGLTITPHLPKKITTYSSITDAWTDVAKNVKNKLGWRTVGLKYLDLEEAIRFDGRACPKFSYKELLYQLNQGVGFLTIAKRMNISATTVTDYTHTLKELGLVNPQRKKVIFHPS